MDIEELLYESTFSLTVNKVRTGLAMLGVIIGIGSVIALVSIGQASQQSITNQIQSLGTNLLTIRPGANISSGVMGAAGSADTLTEDDAELLEKSPLITTIAAVSPEVNTSGQLVAGRNNVNAQIVGATPAYATVNNLELSNGSFINDRQQTGLGRVIVLGPNLVTELFGEGANPVGQQVRLNGQALTVIGVTASKGGSGRFNADDMAYVPLSTAQKVLFGFDSLTGISVAAKDADSMSLAKNQITQVLLDAHQIDNPDEADFQIFSQEDLLGTASQITGTFTTLLSGIAAISLVVGGIGIMNIMLITVTERTREIGIRKALGANRQVIITQFLLETIMITLVGGLIGVLIGISISWGLARLMSLPLVVSFPAIAVATLVSILIGVLFGWYPAQKAAHLQPIEALRYE